MSKLKKIVVTGPESSGKTTLAKQLANTYGAIYAPEYARYYLESINRPYEISDIPEIGKGQLKLQQDLVLDDSKLLICDTSILVLKMWFLHKYNIQDAWVDEAFKNDPVDLYLLCKPDIPWEPDPLRENPKDRDILFEKYHSALFQSKMPFTIISGDNLDKRLSLAIKAMQLHSLTPNP